MTPPQHMMTPPQHITNHLSIFTHHSQKSLDEEERYRNSRRLELLYMKSTHPLAPDVYEMANSSSNLSKAQRAGVQQPIDPDVRINGLVTE